MRVVSGTVAFTILSLPFGIMTTFIYGLIAGGPAAFIYKLSPRI